MVPRQNGWCRDLPGHQDLTIGRPPVRRLLAKIPRRSSAPPEQIDWREYCPPVSHQGPYPTGSASASIAMVQYFEKRATGRSLTPSRMFVHYVACRLAGAEINQPISLRNTLKSMIRFGIPPEMHWPYDERQWLQIPDGFLYGFTEYLTGCRYLRLDRHDEPTEKRLHRVKSFVAAGFGVVFGLTLPEQMGDEADIFYPSRYDRSGVSQAMLCVGYDDRRRIRSEKGALLVMNSWGEQWGEQGFGWLPYRYVTDLLAVDFWTLLKTKWLKSDEFLRPR